MKVETSNEASAYKSKPGFGRIAKAAGYSVAGLAAAWRHEVAFRQLALLACVLIPVGFMVGSTPVERALLVLPVLTSLAIELVNSAIEAVVDLVSPERIEEVIRIVEASGPRDAAGHFLPQPSAELLYEVFVEADAQRTGILSGRFAVEPAVFAGFPRRPRFAEK